TMWTRKWTFLLPWQRDDNYQMFEYACHEGNYGMEGILTAGTLEEAAEGPSGATKEKIDSRRAGARVEPGVPARDKRQTGASMARISRGSRRSCSLLIAMAVVATTTRAPAGFQQTSNSALDVVRVRPNIYMIAGVGGNITVQVGPIGAI